ncbi:MAG: hypothetical protein Q4A30_00060 [Candidatus Saccharibacteria bacterium]|nr:hypothetical protein [Candidatus Saccharibacteria bacterium]
MKKVIINKVLKWAISLTGLTLVVMHFYARENWPKIWSYIATIILPWVPEILAKMGLKFSRRLELAYLWFLMPAMVMGIDFEGYKNIWAFDKLVHGLSGGLTLVVGLEFWQILASKMNWKKVTKQEKVLKSWFAMGIVAIIAVGWECFEFFYDQFCDGRMQQLVSTGVADTMWDLVMAMIGGIIILTLNKLRTLIKQSE